MWRDRPGGVGDRRMLDEVGGAGDLGWQVQGVASGEGGRSPKQGVVGWRVVVCHPLRQGQVGRWQGGCWGVRWDRERVQCV